MPSDSGKRRSIGDRLFEHAYTDFGVAPPHLVDQWAYVVTVTGALCYIGLTGLFWLTLNFFSLFFGVYVEPLWRPNAKFRRLKLRNGIPLIGIFMPILLIIAGYNTFLLRGLAFAIGPYIVVAVMGCLFIAIFVIFNLARRSMFNRPRPRIAGRSAE